MYQAHKSDSDSDPRPNDYEVKKAPSPDSASLSDINKHSTPLDDFAFVNRTIRKVDLRLLPILGSIYAFSLIDRNNLSNALISGASVEIRLGVGNHYSLATLVFFIPYIILEIPSNIVFRRVGASKFLGTIGLLWGAIMISMGFVKTWNQMAALRGLLGILEAGFFPACVWLISCWYTRIEVQTRLAAFYLVSVVVGAFSSSLAYGLSQIKADHLSGWRWILIIEGIITCSLSILGFFAIVDFPDKNNFLTYEETQLVKERVELDRADTEHDALTVEKCLRYACDLKLYSFSLGYLCTTLATYAYGYFTPIILVGMGFSIKNAQLLIAPTGLCACLIALIMSRLSDRTGMRGPFIILQACMAITGLSMTAFHPKNAVRFAGCFIGLAGAQGNIPSLLAYQSNNIRRQSKRAFASAMQVAFGGVGGIVASLAYRQQDSPRYRLGITITIAFQGLLILLVVLNSIWFIYRNNQVKKGGKPIEGYPGFLYTL